MSGPSWVNMVFLLTLKISLQGRWSPTATGKDRKSRRAEVKKGNGSQGIKAKQELDFMSGEKVGTMRLFIQKTGLIPFGVFSGTLKPS